MQGRGWQRKARESSTRVGILGSGLMGGKLGTIFARAGHELVIQLCAQQREAEETGPGRSWELAGGHTE